MTEGEIQNLIQEFNNSDDRLILLDYDGTLVDFNPVPSRACLSEQAVNTLEKLANKPGIKICVITGRSKDDIDQLLGSLNIDTIAEHGALVRENRTWRKDTVDNKRWQGHVIKEMERMMMKCPGSYVETKQFSLAWHYRNAENDAGFMFSRDLIQNLEKTAVLKRLKVLDGNKVVEVMNCDIGKGIALDKILDSHFYDFVLSVGDDVTDEEMFEYSMHHANAFTIKVGNGISSAKYKLNGVKEVLSLLKLLS